MKKLFLFVHNELRLIFRDKRALLLLYLMPALLVFVLSSVLSHLYENQVPRLSLLIHSESQSTISDKIASELRKTQKRVEFTDVLPEKAPKGFDLLIHVPSNLSQLLRKSPDASEIPAGRVEFVFYKFLDPFQKTFMMKEFVRMLQSTVIEEINAEIVNREESGGMQLVSDPSSLIVERQDLGARILPPLSFSLASWSLFAIFFIVIPFSNAFFRDWTNHIFVRFRALGVSKVLIFSGRVLAFVFVNFTQFLFLLLLSLYVFPLVLGAPLAIASSSLLPIFAVVLCCSAAATAFALFVSCLVKTQEQASALGAFSVVILSLLGGVMIPSIFMPEYMTKYISIFSPLYWGLSAFAEAFQVQLDSGLFLRQLLVLLAFAVFFYTAALRMFRWEK